MKIPTDYVDGYESARRVDPELAWNYIRYMRIADSEADTFVEGLHALPPGEINRMIAGGRTGMRRPCVVPPRSSEFSSSSCQVGASRRVWRRGSGQIDRRGAS